MKTTFFILLSLLLTMGCTSQSKNSEKNIALIEEYVEAVETMDFDAMESYLADDYLGIGPSYGDSIRKDQAIQNWKYNVENLYEKIDYEMSRNVAVTLTTGDNQGEWVSNWAQLHIVYKDNRGAITIWANSTYQIENGKIIKSFTFYNEADAMRQLGYVFIDPTEL